MINVSFSFTKKQFIRTPQVTMKTTMTSKYCKQCLPNPDNITATPNTTKEMSQFDACHWNDKSTSTFILTWGDLQRYTTQRGISQYVNLVENLDISVGHSLPNNRPASCSFHTLQYKKTKHLLTLLVTSQTIG